jgi:hypothetical protein
MKKREGSLEVIATVGYAAVFAVAGWVLSIVVITVNLGVMGVILSTPA